MNSPFFIEEHNLAEVFDEEEDCKPLSTIRLNLTKIHCARLETQNPYRSRSASILAPSRSHLQANIGPHDNATLEYRAIPRLIARSPLCPNPVKKSQIAYRHTAFLEA